MDLPLAEGTFRWSGGVLPAFDSTIVRIDTTDDISGWGEVCPLGPAYLPAYAEGARTGIEHLARHLIGMDPTRLSGINMRMDAVLNGHPYAKSALDMACWDILGQVAGTPVSTLMGGVDGEAVDLYRAVSQDTSEVMAERVRSYQEEGYRRFQLKVGEGFEADVDRVRAVVDVLRPGDSVIADANKGWLTHEAVRVVSALGELDVYVEQPCASYEECLSVRRRTGLPFILDESIDSLRALIRAHGDDAMDAINIKISKYGGLTKAMRIRDVCAELGIAMIIEDACGGDIVTAAVSHLAHSTLERLRLASTDLNGYITRSYGEGAPRRQGGRIRAPQRPGMGVEVDEAELGQPLFSANG